MCILPLGGRDCGWWVLTCNPLQPLIFHCLRNSELVLDFHCHSRFVRLMKSASSFIIHQLEAPISRHVMENEPMNPWVDGLKHVKRSSIDIQKNLILKTLENT
ncbi:hypothetical protein HanPI659440_Chr17g0699601 [Helianthus annuus]|nr:hypothetical protein HanPI659440_Chr17g0699601 [Helianthus annuus]